MVSGISFKFPLERSHEGAFAMHQTTIDSVIDDLKILVLTNHGERPIHGDFGCNLRSILFEQGAGILQRAEDLVLDGIQKWMPFVKVNEILVLDSTLDSTLKPNELRLRLNFTVGQIQGSLNQVIR